MALNLSPKIFDKLHDTPRKSALAIGLGTLALVIALFVFAIVPATSSVIEQYERNKERQVLVDAQNLKIDNINKLLQAEERHASEIELLNENYPDFVDTEYIARNINDYIVQSGDVTIRSVGVDDKLERVASFVTSTEATKYNRYEIIATPVVINYFCSVESSVKFLNYIENYPSILNITEASYNFIENADAGNPPNLPLDCNLELVYYSKLLKPEPTPAPTLVPSPTGN